MFAEPHDQVGILVLEDESSTMDLVVHYLEGASRDARISTAECLGAALGCLAEQRIDLIIADLHLPDSRGLDTVDALRRAGDQLIIVLTGDEDPNLRAGALQRGAYDFLHKSQLNAATLGRLVRLAELQARTRQSLRASQARLNAIIETEPECVKLLDADGTLLEMHPAGLRMIEADSIEPVRGHCVLDLVDSRHRQAFRDLTREVAGGRPGRLQFEIVGLKGTRRWLETHAVPFTDPVSGKPLVLGVTRDITEGKRLELRSERLARMYAALSASNEAMLRAENAQALLASVCRASVDNGGFLAAAVMLADGTGAIRLAAASGRLEGYLRRLDVSVDPAQAEGRGLVGEAFRTGRPAIANEYYGDPRTRPWHESSRAAGLAGAAAFPLVTDAGAIGVLLFYSAEANAFDAEMTALLSRIAENAGFALELLARETQRLHEERLVALEHSVTRSLAEAAAVDDALRSVMRAVCEAGSWDLGRYFRHDERAGRMRFAEYWCAEPELEKFSGAWSALEYGPGEGLIGLAWSSGEALWSADVTQDSRVAQAPLARAAGVRGAMAFPVTFESRTLGVLSISSREVREPDQRLLRALRVIGSQIGQYLTRKDAEAALRESEASFRETFELAASGIAHVSLDRRFLRVNSSLCRMLGYRADELVGRSVTDFSHPEDVDLTAEERARMHAGEVESVRFEKRYVHKDGSVAWVDLALALARDKLGAPQYEIAVMEDISGRKETERGRMLAEQRLRSSEARFRRLTELSSDWYWEQDAELRFAATEGSSEERGGISPQVHIGKRRWELPGTEAVSQTWEEHRALLEARQPFRDFVIRRTGDDGEVRYVNVSGTPIFDAQGGFRGYQGVARDITAARRGAHLLALEHAVTRRLAESDDEAQALRAVMRVICEAEGWESGRYFQLDEDAGLMRLREWWSSENAAMRGYNEASRTVAFARGVGLIGQVWASGEPLWVCDVSNDSRVVNSRLARAAGVLGVLVLPVASESRITGVLSLSSRRPREPDERLLRALRVISSQLGQFLQRKAAENVLRESEERFRSLSALSSDWFWETDAEHRFVGTPPRVTEVTGFLAPAYVGKRRWEVPGLAPTSGDWSAHQAVLARRGSFRDLELMQTRADGSLAYLHVSGEPVYGPDGGFRGYRGTAKDVTARKREEEELRRFRAAMDMSIDAIYLVDRASMRFVDVNEAACRGVGYSREQLLNMGPQDLLAAPREELEREYDEVIACGAQGMMVENRYAGASGRTRWTELHRRALRTGDGWIIVSISRDITERKMAEQRQAAHMRHQERIARFGQLAVGKREPGELIDEAVQNLLEGLGAEAVAYVEPGADDSELVLRAVVGAADGGERQAALRCREDAAILDVLRQGSGLQVEDAGLPFAWARALRHAALVPVRGERRPRGALCVFPSAAEGLAADAMNFIEAAASVLSTALQRIDSEGRLAYLAQFDPLTGLPNRALLADRFSQMIVQAKRRGTTLGALFIDLDEFKMVNDTLGHAGGDELLRQVSASLQASVRPGDTVARISGDEFAVVLADLARPDDASLVAQKIIDRLGQPVTIYGQEVFVTGSVGISLFPGDGADAEALLGAADAAMYRAKQSGRNGYQFFTAEINLRSRARAQLGSELRRALERDEFFLVYQPKVALADRQPSGAEALLRWKHPERGTVSPVEFIPVLEETGLIVAVGEWVLRRACADLKDWGAAGLAPGRVSVNLSARQFRLPDLDVRLKAIVAEAGVAPALIELEITESQLVQDPDHAIRMMRSLSKGGMRITIDDFGTGYSSLGYLTRFPVGALKIDRSFVRDLIEDASDATIVRTIIEMAHTLGFTVVAEGIETEAQAEYLKRHGCDEGQGYLFAKPMPAGRLAALLAAARRGAAEVRPGRGKRRAPRPVRRGRLQARTR